MKNDDIHLNWPAAHKLIIAMKNNSVFRECKHSWVAIVHNGTLNTVATNIKKFSISYIYNQTRVELWIGKN